MRMRASVWVGVAVVVVALAASGAAAPKPVVEVKATLRGEVLPEGLAKPGDEVKEGDPLVYVRTQTGRGVAARAPVDGRVVEVLVRPGTVIRELGIVVARLDPK
ncbi:MAG: biotin attachment protein [Armatimonadota bacterium]|nr:biotin attachment protein [Armatimonadota bacterium]MDR7519307.1 biotin attachment protein [Armatimonadota bacterium]MDR7550160.1 biotin attachment protein [Armatimonadota bacterium]